MSASRGPSPPPPQSPPLVPSDPRFGPEHAGLLRLFQSQFFSEWMAISYLFRYVDHDGIQHYLCDALRSQFRVQHVLEYLPQLCHILVVNPGMTHLESLIVDRCRVSAHFALLSLWYFQSYLADLEPLPESLAHVTVARVISAVEGIVQTAPPDLLAALNAAAVAHQASLAAGEGGEGDGAAVMDPLAADLTTQQTPQQQQHLDTTSGRAASKGTPGRRPSSMGSPPSGLSTRASLSSLRMPSSSPSLEDLHQGRAFSYSHFVARVASAQGLSALVNGGGSGGGSSKRSSVASSNGSLTEPPRAANGAALATAAADLAARNSRSAPPSAVGPSTSSSSSSASPPPRAGEIVFAAAVRDQLALATTANAAWTVPPAVSAAIANDPRMLEQYYFHSQLNFISTLASISNRLVAVPRDARQSSLTAELTLLNHNFPAPVCIPLWCTANGGACKDDQHRRHHQIVRISPTDAVVLNSADRVPFLLFIEVLEDDGDDDEDVLGGADLGLRKGKRSSGADSQGSGGSSGELGTETTSTLLRPARAIVRRRSSLSLLSSALASGMGALSLGPDAASTHAAQQQQQLQHPLSPTLRKSPSTPSIRDALGGGGSNGVSDASAVAGAGGINSSLSNGALSVSLTSGSVAPMIPGFLTHREFEDRMRTAAIMLAQLAVQEANDPKAAKRRRNQKPPTHLSPGGTGLGGGTSSGKMTDEIRARILREMMALEERRLEAVRSWHRAHEQEGLEDGEVAAAPDGTGTLAPSSRRGSDMARRTRIGTAPAAGSTRTADMAAAALSAAAGGGTGGSPRSAPAASHHLVSMDKDDPSSAVVRETWARKRARIRSASAFGRHPYWQLHSVIVKTGADLRQEQLACQLVREMARVWKCGPTGEVDAAVGCWLYPYRVLVTGQGSGIIETVRNTVSLHSLKKDAYARFGDQFTLRQFFGNEFGPETSAEYKQAINAFSESLAGYSIMSYVLSVKDRHNGNILLDYTTGRMVHIDFGFMLSNSPGAVSFESAPFKLAHEYVELLDGFGSARFRDWRNRMVHGFLALRRDHERLVGLVEMMERNSPLDCFSYTSLHQAAGSTSSLNNSGAGTPSPSSAPGTTATSSSTSGSSSSPLPVSAALRERLLLTLTDVQVAEFVDRLIASSLGNVVLFLFLFFFCYHSLTGSPHRPCPVYSALRRIPILYAGCHVVRRVDRIQI
ncbi:kinase-like domain-containing protein [Blastocladiella britannica]|nr:kinase-like domain-containing protein [Blastocladiella britannica]